MPKLSLKKDDGGLHITLLNTTPTIVQNDSFNNESFQLRFDVGNDSVVAELSPSELQTLALQCVALIPHLGLQTATGAEEASRRPARLLKDLDNRSIQLLLREIQHDSLIDFLWCMKDAELIKLILRNMSERAAEMLMDELDTQWHGKDPDNTFFMYVQRGHEAIQAIMGIVRRLITEGMIPDVLGEGR